MSRGQRANAKDQERNRRRMVDRRARVRGMPRLDQETVRWGRLKALQRATRGPAQSKRHALHPANHLQAEVAALRRIGRMARDPRRRPRAARQAMLRRLYIDYPETRKLRKSAAMWRARYLYDPEFTSREIDRAHKRKAARVAQAFWLEDGTLTPAVKQRLFAEAKECPYCGATLDPRRKTIDHVVPQSRGGLHSIRNVLVCCRTCNTRKAGLTPSAWLRRLSKQRRSTVRLLYKKLKVLGRGSVGVRVACAPPDFRTGPRKMRFPFPSP